MKFPTSILLLLLPLLPLSLALPHPVPQENNNNDGKTKERCARLAALHTAMVEGMDKLGLGGLRRTLNGYYTTLAEGQGCEVADVVAEITRTAS